MHFDEADSDLLKEWVIKQLEHISDADSDVLADYVLALIKTDDPEPTAKRNCVENLSDFLLDNTQSFVDDVFTAIATKAYKPSQSSSKPASSTKHATSLDAPKQPNGSRKRSNSDRERNDGPPNSIPTFAGDDRPVKHARRNGRGGFDQRGGRFAHASPRQNGPAAFTQHNQLPFPQISAQPPGIDPNNFALAFASMPPAMQQAFNMFQEMAGAAASQNQSISGGGQRCRDYDTKGFCARGASCHFEHGNDPFVVPPNIEYDPSQATLLNVQPNRTGYLKAPSNTRGRGGSRGRGRGGQHPRGGRRSEISHHGPNHDKSLRKVVVEQIPDEYLNETSIQDFFGDFGNIQSVSMQPDKRLAVVEFDDPESAQAAYDSPKVVFENRFVKVYWYKPDNVSKPANGHTGVQNQRWSGGDIEMQEQETEIDYEEIARKQEEAQRKHEEQLKMREEADKQRQELDLKIEAMENQRKQMMKKLGSKAGTGTATSEDVSNQDGKLVESDQTRLLREHVARLEAEAKKLGIDPDVTVDESNNPPFRGRGGFRGRARGRGYYQGNRGGWAAGTTRGGGAVKRLDNRPKTVAIRFHEGRYDDHQEALRQFLLFNNAAGDSASLNPHPGLTDTALVAFPERYQGEMFMAAADTTGSPFTGKIDLSWYTPEQTPKIPDNTTVTDAAATGNSNAHQYGDTEAYDLADDVADDDDRWG